MKHLSLSPRRHQGFTLVELMVGLLLGLLAVLAITQVLALSEGRKRTMAAGSDSQVNGALAVFTLQRELEMAGYGLTAKPDALGCPLAGSFITAGPPAATETFSGTLAPVVITSGTNGAPDTLTILEARKSGFSVPVMVTAQNTDYFTVLSSLGVSAGDVMVAVPTVAYPGYTWSATTSTCRLFSVTDDGAGSSSNTGLWAQRVPHTQGGATSWNDNTALTAAFPAIPAYLVNLGSLSYNQYTVNTSSLALQVTSHNATAASSTSVLFPQIVNLQALYGKDTNNDGLVDTFDKTAPTTNDGWAQVLAVRIAVVARSTQYEKSKADKTDAVTQSAPLWDLGASSTVTGVVSCHNGSKCLQIKIDHVTDWQNYRYRIYDTTVPLRNILWNAGS